MNDNFMELKEQKIWLCWNFAEKDGRKTKVPIAANGEKTGTNEAYRHTWVTFNEAKQAAQNRRYSGVGFVIPEGYFFLDIDHRELNDTYVKTMLERFGSYAEKSVSGEGLHIYGRCDFSQIPTEEKNGRRKLHSKYYQKNPNNGTELYIGGLTNRFAVFTGNVVLDKPMKDCTAAVLTTLDNEMLRKRDVSSGAPTDKAAAQRNRSNGAANRGSCGRFFDEREAVPSVPKRAHSGDCSDIIRKLRRQKNGEKFSRLFDVGDFSDYGSHSEADLALCCMIAYRTGDNPSAIDSIFRQSALYRPKWEREDYREETIRKSTESLGSQRAFGKNNMTKPFIRINDKGQPSVSVPLLVKYIEENVRFLLVRDNGKQSLLKYVYEDGVYRLYSDDMFRGLIREIIADYDIELVKMRTINEAFSLIMTSLNSIPHSVLNRDESVINFQNGLLHIGDTLELTEHSPDVLTTIQIPCDWTGCAQETPVFDSYLETLTNGDDKTKTLLLEFIGACVSNIRGWRLKKSLFMVGSGDTGKSQLKSLVERLLGKGNFIGIDLSEIEARFGTGAIYGTRLAGSSDMSFMTVSELKTFKKITGGDSLFAEFKGQQAFEYTYNGLLWFCMNRLPKFGGDDGKWVYDRIMVVNCPNVIPPEKQDKRLLDKMYRERQGIIYKAINALLNVIKNDYRFTESESVTQAREDYMTDNNTAIAFFNECMRPWVRGKIQKHCTTGRVYKVYQAWCRENNNGYAKTAKEFREELSAYLGAAFADLTVVRNGYKYYKDYGLTLEAKELYASAYGYDEDEFLSV